MNEKQIDEIMSMRDEEFLMQIEGLEFEGVNASEEQDEIEELNFDQAA
jgi:hypothetical protein